MAIFEDLYDESVDVYVITRSKAVGGEPVITVSQGHGSAELESGWGTRDRVNATLVPQATNIGEGEQGIATVAQRLLEDLGVAGDEAARRHANLVRTYWIYCRDPKRSDLKTPLAGARNLEVRAAAYKFWGEVDDVRKRLDDEAEDLVYTDDSDLLILRNWSRVYYAAKEAE